MRVLVCGGREFCNWVKLHNTLSDIGSETPITCIIQSEAKGADWVKNYTPINIEELK